MNANLFSTIVLALLCTFSISVHAQTDKEGSQDHPLIERFKQSYIYDYEVTSFDAYPMATGKATDYEISSRQNVEGKVFRIFYVLPTDAGSNYEIFTNYKNALTSKGAKILFSCKDKGDCGKYFWDALNEKHLMPAYFGEELAYLAAKFSKDGMTYYITVTAGYGLGEQGYEVHIIETKEMQQQISLDGIERALSENGKVSLYGILFDTGSDKLKESSLPEIELIAQYLKKNPAKKVYIVGHTDNTGNFQSNMTLSQNRAKTVVQTLSAKYGIAADRLQAVGVGPVAPESKNTTDSGRQKNRRVEVVLNEI